VGSVSTTVLLFAARGIQALGAAAGDVLDQLRRRRSDDPIAAGVMLLAFTVADVTYYLPRHMQLYHNITAIAGMPDLYANAPRDAIGGALDWYIYSDEGQLSLTLSPVRT